MMRYTYLFAMVMATTACDALFMPSADMQGHDPVAYYAKNPIKNKVEMRHALYTVEYAGGQNKLNRDNMEDLEAALAGVRPEAAESVKIKLAPAQMNNEERRENLAKFLRNMGFERRAITFRSSAGVRSHEADIDVKYAAVVLPHCPDWRMSPTTTHSNTKQANIGCAAAVNLGLMVADPRDLVRSDAHITPDSERGTKVIRRYHEGADTPSSGSGSGTATPASGDGSSSAGGATTTP